MDQRRLLIAGLAVSCFALMAQAADQRPNIVLIISDDQGWTDYGFMGHPAIQTPHLDTLAKQSVTFRRGYVPTALCRPSLATLATGLYAHQSLITGNDPAKTPANQRHATRSGKDPRELLIANIDRIPTVPRILGQQGYLSFQCGKWWEGNYQRGGFTHGMTRGYPERGGRHGDDGLTIGRSGMQPLNDFIDTAIEAEKPFFIWYAPFLPHTPHNPPPRLLKKYEQEGRSKAIATYYAMCEWFDETCGQLLNRLDEKGIAENTLVIYVTDNGWIQNPTRGGYAPRSKRSPYEGGIRTPIMFRWPDKMQPADRPELCSSIDIAPTILAAAGADIPQELPGLNLLANLKQGIPIPRDTIFGEAFAHDIADIQNPEASLLYRWVIRDHTKLLLTYDGRPGRMKYPPSESQPQLFDLKADPHEEVNLASKKPELVKELGRLIGDWYPLEERQVEVLPTGKEISQKSLASQCSANARTKPRRPNILFIMTDQQHAGMLSCSGNTNLKTPALDRLARDGMRFKKAYVVNPVCVPSRISMATGVMPGRLGVFSNGMKAVVPDEVAKNSLGKLMQRASYDTFYGGKVHMCPELVPQKAGYDVVVRDQRDALPDACIEFMQREREQPFSAVASFINPHDICYAHAAHVGKAPKGMQHVVELYRKATALPSDQLPPLPANYAIPANEPDAIENHLSPRAVTPAGTMRREYDQRQWQIYRWIYCRLTEDVDRQIGRILNAVQQSGLEETTLVLFTSDHGNMDASHQLASKGQFYEESVRVPFLMKYKGVIPAGRVDSEHLVATGLDILPTLCDYAGVEVPETLLGHSLRGIAEGRSAGRWRRFVASENSWGRMIRSERFKYCVYDDDSDRESLVDMTSDPDESTNLVADRKYHQTLVEHRRHLLQWIKNSHDTEAKPFAVDEPQPTKR